MVAQIRALAREYRAFGEVSGLTLNIPKSGVLPLRREPLASAASCIREAMVGWERLEIAHKAKYLGFCLGPGSSGAAGKAPWPSSGPKWLAGAGLARG